MDNTQTNWTTSGEIGEGFTAESILLGGRDLRLALTNDIEGDEEPRGVVRPTTTRAFHGELHHGLLY